uniref:Phospholipid/glycerol acyltransferase domain-containing protein n=1 Tax=Corethron hystrix TaxID=216773 RepID=A0A7S1G1K2_9STRA|mmetsp:Transcript_8426/g.18485  ORF Transcript_8426/g.18485 Transcript_8426/m.18485 type:complete len:312 (+) Transcript_8426:444-1379(+)
METMRRFRERKTVSKTSSSLLVALFVAAAGIEGVHSYAPHFAPPRPRRPTHRPASIVDAEVLVPPFRAANDPADHVLSAGPGGVGPTLSFGGREVNLFGFRVLAAAVLTCPVWGLALNAYEVVAEAVGRDPNRVHFDGLGKIWSRVFLWMSDCFPERFGREHVAQEGRAVLYAANHASWLDIPLLCTSIDPVFKFIAKGELRKVPCIGKQLVGGKHILIDREDRRSQLRTFKEGVAWLKSGVPLMAFPEGTRSDDGHLQDFKGGIFSMAVKVGVPVVPVTITHAHAVMPSNALFPFQVSTLQDPTFSIFVT